MARIIMSYRRGDTRAIAGRLHDALLNALGSGVSSDASAGAVALGVDTLVQPADDYVIAIEKGIKAAEVLVILIGPSWLADGWTQKADDFDRIALKIALAEKKRVIPVLVDGAIMPPASSLPDDVSAITRRIGIDLKEDTFRADAARLIEALPKVPTTSSPVTPPPASTPPASLPITVPAVSSAPVSTSAPINAPQAQPAAASLSSTQPAPAFSQSTQPAPAAAGSITGPVASTFRTPAHGTPAAQGAYPPQATMPQSPAPAPSVFRAAGQPYAPPMNAPQAPYGAPPGGVPAGNPPGGFQRPSFYGQGGQQPPYPYAMQSRPGDLFTASLVVVVLNFVAWLVVVYVAAAIVEDSDNFDQLFLLGAAIGTASGLALGYSVRAFCPSVSQISVWLGAIAIGLGIGLAFDTTAGSLSFDFYDGYSYGMDRAEATLRIVAMVGLSFFGPALAFSRLDETPRPGLTFTWMLETGAVLVAFPGFTLALLALLGSDGLDSLLGWIDDAKLLAGVIFGIYGAIIALAMLWRVRALDVIRGVDTALYPPPPPQAAPPGQWRY